MTPNTQEGPAPSNAQRRIKRVSYAKYGYIFILPFFLVYFIFSFSPLIATFKYSMEQNTVPGGIQQYQGEFVGLDNYKDIFTEQSKYITVTDEFGEYTSVNPAYQTRENFWNALKNTVKIWIINFIPQIVLSLALAAWFTDATLKIKGKSFFKIVMYMPNILTAASVAALASQLFSNTTMGPVNSLLLNFGLIDSPISFIGNYPVKQFLVGGIQAWMWFGNTTILLMSGIAGINPSLFEAANIDGASGMQIFTKITLPLLRPILLFTVITSMIGGFQMFDIPYLLQSVATERTAITKTVVVFIHEYFNNNAATDPGHAGAASIILFAITTVLGVFVFFFNRDKDEIAKKKNMKMLRKQAMEKSKRKYGGLGI